MSRTSIGAGLGLLVLAWSASALASEEDLSLDLGASALELRRIPKGSFRQGSPPTEAGREADEVLHDVTISHAFWLGKVPVTRSQFSRFVTETHFVTDAEKGQVGGFGWDGKALVQKKEFTWRNPGFPQRDEDPVVLVTFADANAFTAWAAKKSGRRVRLPSEAEWEYAARAGTSTPWSGAVRDDEALSFGWFRTNSPNGTRPVGTKRPNAFGIFDMAGNVFEWCRDVYAPYPAGEALDPLSIAPASAEPERRVLRGGSWLRETKRGRSAARNRGAPGSKNADNGFRVAIDDDPAGAALPGAPAPDDRRAAPVGSADSRGGTSPNAVASSAPSEAARARGPEGSVLSLVVAPLAAAASVVAWILARRRKAGALLPDREALRRSQPSIPDPPSSGAPVGTRAPMPSFSSVPALQLPAPHSLARLDPSEKGDVSNPSLADVPVSPAVTHAAALPTIEPLPASEPALPASEPALDVSAPHAAALPTIEPLPASEAALPASEPALPAIEPALPAIEPALPAIEPAEGASSSPAGSPASPRWFESSPALPSSSSSLVDDQQTTRDLSAVTEPMTMPSLSSLDVTLGAAEPASRPGQAAPRSDDPGGVATEAGASAEIASPANALPPELVPAPSTEASAPSTEASAPSSPGSEEPASKP